ncbi:MAG TPA: type II toxin-antitoxin system Phd/YefM family antitoxin [Planctomycetota bacterium]|nr:type II toxin-antitoxin system Phd/YefM family antitoxin [Planctomycetota bacterium]
MGLARDIRTVTEMKARAAQLLEEVNLEKRPLVITQDGKPRAVMMDVESYEELRNAIGLLKLLSQGEEDIRAGRWVEQESLFKRLQTRLEARLQTLPKHGRKKT